MTGDSVHTSASFVSKVDDKKSDAGSFVDFAVACAAFWFFGSLFMLMSFKECLWSFLDAIFLDMHNPQVRAFLLWGGMSIMGGIITVVLLLLLWHTLSFKSSAMHSFWKWSPWFAPALMPGGFFSRPAAITVVILLFTTTSLTMATVTAGGALAGAGVCERVEGEMCYPKWAFPNQPYAFEAPPPTNVSLGLLHPCTQSSDFVCLEEDPSKTCSYTCVKYDTWGVDLFLPKVGAILGGSAFVVKVADSLSLAVGWGLVTEDTSPEEIRRIAIHQGKQLFPRRSCAACALQLLALAALMQQCAMRVDSNGPHTVESTVTLVVLISISTAVFQRLWSPAHCGRLYYTRKLWQEGSDLFVQENEESGDLELRQLDLFEWIHLTNKQRLAHLVNYARRVDSGPGSKGTKVTSLASGDGVHEEDYDMVMPNGDKRTVLTRHNVTVHVGAMGKVVREQGGKILVLWEHSQKVTAVEPCHLSEHSEEWDACVRDIGLLETEQSLAESLL